MSTQANTLIDEIRFRCEGDLKGRLKRVVRGRFGKFAKPAAVARDVIRVFVENEEALLVKAKSEKRGVAA